MQKKTCPNGHVYDQSIYGDTCPLCPPPAAGGSQASNLTIAAPAEQPASGAGAHTRVAPPPANPAPSAMPNAFSNIPSPQDPVGHTRVAPSVQQQAQQQTAPAGGARTTIRRNPAMMGAAAKPGEEGRKLVGFLVTYNRTPMGKAFNIYEGRNYIGRDESCDISIPDDSQMSGKHMLIRYLSGNNKFSFKDEMSSNGTYVNKELLDEGELQNYDIIRVGSTLFIFIAIPQI